MKLKRHEKETSDKKMGQAIRRFIDLAGEDIWRARVDRVKTLLAQDEAPFYCRWLLQQNPLLGPVCEYFGRRDKHARLSFPRSRALIYLAGEAHMVTTVYRKLNSYAKERIRQALADDEAIAPFLFEMGIATHFLVNDWDVDFVDLERSDASARTYDLLVRKGRAEVEVECKRISADAGVGITRRAVARLGDEICKRGPFDGNYLLRVVCDDMLTEDEGKLCEIASRVRQCMQVGDSQVRLDGHTVHILRLPDTEVVRNDADAAKAMARYWDQAGHMAIRTTGGATVILQAGTPRAAKVVRAIARRLSRRAPKQLSATRAGAICCFLEGIEGWALESLRDKGALKDMTYRFFTSKRRDNSHVNMVSFASSAVLRKEANVWTSFSHELHFENPRPRYCIEEEMFPPRPAAQK